MTSRNSENWQDDLLGRQANATFLTRYLENRFGRSATTQNGDAFVLNINSGWGFGKTYFLTNWKTDLEMAGYPVIYFDAWRNDFSDEPLLGFIAELDRGFSKTFARGTALKKKAKSLIESGSKLLKPALPVLVAALVKKIAGVNVNELADVFDDDWDEFEGHGLVETGGKAEDGSDGIPDTLSKAVQKAGEHALKRHKSIQRSILEFRENLKRLVEHIRPLASYQLPIFVMVDELDRCRPTYAIELLETIKHLFGVSGVCFVVATDTRQLSSSVKAIYGADFEAELYLKRFFDQEYVLPDPDYGNFAQLLFQSNLKDDILIPVSAPQSSTESLPANVFATLAEDMRLDLRAQGQCFNTLDAIRRTWQVIGVKLHLPFLVFLIMLRHKSQIEFERFTKSPQIFTGGNLFGVNLNEEKKYPTKTPLQDGGYSSSRISIRDLINTYIGLYMMANGGDLNRRFTARIDQHEESILSALLNAPTNIKYKNHLRMYPQLVTQAGQLS